MKYVNIIQRALVSHDPMDILKQSLPIDAYLTEAQKISQQLPCCKNPHDLKKLIHSIFVTQFSLTIAGHEKNYWELANDLWSEIKTTEINNKDLSTYESVVIQQWEELERGWGDRPDGVSIHLNDHDRVLFIKEYQEELPNDEVPHEYSRPFGDSFCALVPLDIYNAVNQSITNSRGIRYFHYEVEICSTKNGTRFLRRKK